MKEIRNIIAKYDATDHSTEKLALASVVNVEESSYRRIGARMLVSSSGQWIGGISGGCLEGDALKRSQKAIFKYESSRVVYDTMDDDKNQIGVGLGCNGRIEVLFTPIDKDDPANIIEQLRTISKSDKANILLKIIEVKGDQSKLGKSQIANQNLDDLNFYDLDSESLKVHIQETRDKRRPQIINLKNKDGDTLKVLVEYIRPEIKLIIIGDNYDVNALVGIAGELGWEVNIVGRVKKLSKTIFAKAKKVYEYEDFDQVTMHNYTGVILMSHDYNWDKKLLPAIIKHNPPYIGILGPKKRMLKMQTELGLKDLDAMPNIYSPVGLDIGAESPEEIAVSIGSEIIASFRNREGSSLREKTGSIHDRH